MTDGPLDKSLPQVSPAYLLPPVSRWSTWGGLALLGVFGGSAALASWLSFPVTIKAAATVRPEGELRQVETAMAGTVEQILVQANQLVQQGDVVATLVDTELRSQEQQGREELSQTQQQLSQIEAQLLALSGQIAAENRATTRTVAVAQERLTAAERTYQDQQTLAQTNVREAEASVRLAQEELKRFRRLANSGALADLQIREKEASLETAEARLDRAQATLNPTAAQVNQAREEIAQAQALGEADQAQLLQRKEQLSRQQTELQKQVTALQQRLQQQRLDLNKLTIRAPVAGTMQELNLRNPGQVVDRGEVVAQVVPEQAALTVKALVSQERIGEVAVGQRVTMRVDSCVYTDYGVLPGEIRSIAPDSQVIPTSDSVNGAAYYAVDITPDQLVLGQDENRRCPLKVGMEGRADIVTREETTVQFVFRSLRLWSDL